MISDVAPVPRNRTAFQKFARFVSIVIVSAIVGPPIGGISLAIGGFLFGTGSKSFEQFVKLIFLLMYYSYLIGTILSLLFSIPYSISKIVFDKSNIVSLLISFVFMFLSYIFLTSYFFMSFEYTLLKNFGAAGVMFSISLLPSLAIYFIFRERGPRQAALEAGENPGA